MEDTRKKAETNDGAAEAPTHNSLESTESEIPSLPQSNREQGQAAPTEASANAGDALAGISFRTAGHRNDGTAEILVAPDSMSAEATLFPPTGEGMPIGMDYVRDLLARLGVTSGILWSELEEAVLRANLDRHVLRGVIAAQGSQPVAEVPEHLELEQRFSRSGPAFAEGQQKVDFRQLGSVHVVKAGETIGTFRPKIAGSPGKDVRGNSTPFQRAAIRNWSIGTNLERRGEILAAKVEGRLLITGDRLDVDEVLIVKGGVDFSTGHIVFPGDVVIDGPIHDGFKVWSGGTIVCKSPLDAFDVNAKKDLVCAQGIIGRRKAEIRVGRDLKAKFIQNCRVAVRGDVHIANAVVNCRLYSLGRVYLGDKGTIMGGEVYAVHGIRCGRLGNEARQRTMIHAGTDFTVQQQLDQANEELRLLSIRAHRAEDSAPGKPEKDRIHGQVQAATAKIAALISSLLQKLDADDSAVVEIRSEIFPGVIIEICRVQIVIEEHMKACRFRLDKTAGKIVVEH